MRTDDGGAHWRPVDLAPPPASKHADLNLFGLSADSRGQLFASAERGMVLRSDDKGQSWNHLSTGHEGSLWTGIAVLSGALLVAGLRGSTYCSVDEGDNWLRVDTHTESSVTALAANGSRIVAVGLDGRVLRSRDGGPSFVPSTREDRLLLTSVALDFQGRAIMCPRQGVTAADGPEDPSPR